MRGRRRLPRRLARALREGESKKFSRLKNFRELRLEFPGLGNEDKHYPERKSKNKNENTDETKL